MRLIDADALKKEVESLVVGGAEGLKDYYENGSKSDENAWIGGIYDAWELIDNAPTVDVISNEESYEMYGKGYLQGYERGKNERPQSDLADEVWKLYEKYHSHLATNVIEFGDELKDLLDKYKKGGKE